MHVHQINIHLHMPHRLMARWELQQYNEKGKYASLL